MLFIEEIPYTAEFMTDVGRGTVQWPIQTVSCQIGDMELWTGHLIRDVSKGYVSRKGV